METRLRKNCCNSAQLTTRKFLKIRISYSRSLILPYLLLSKVTCYVTCPLKGKDKIEDGGMGPSSRPGPVLGHFMFKKVFLPKDRLVPVCAHFNTALQASQLKTLASLTVESNDPSVVSGTFHI